jgi:hypothetical protein
MVAAIKHQVAGYIEKWANPNTLQMMTKDMAFAMYNLSPIRDQMIF